MALLSVAALTAFLAVALAVSSFGAHAADAAKVRAGKELEALTDRIVDTPAIGIFTKLSLKGKADELLSSLEAYHSGDGSRTLNEIEERYMLLVQKLVLMLQKKDPQLAREVAAAREPLWLALADPNAFKTL